MKFFSYIVLPKEISDFERGYLRRVNRIALAFFALHIPVYTAIAWFNDTRPALAFGLTLLVFLGPLVASRALQNPRSVSLVFGITAMAMGGLLVNFGRGPMTIEMHFYFFVLLALLSVFGNPLPIVVAAVTVTLHHAVFWALFPEAVFNYEASLGAVALHATFVALESAAACFVARSFFDNVIGLDRIVQARTLALDLRNLELSLILDNVGQGLLTVDRAANVPAERSAILGSWFGAPVPGETLFSWVSRVDASAGAWLEVSWDSAFDDILPVEVTLDQFPKRLRAGKRHLELEYRPIFSGKAVDKLLVVVSDVSDRVERDEAELLQRELLAAFQRVLSDRLGFLDFLDEAARLVAAVSNSTLTHVERLRALHTLKGNLAIFGIGGLAKHCHDLESAVHENDEALDPATCAELERLWQAFTGRLARILEASPDGVLNIARSEYDALRVALRDGKLDNMQVLSRLDRWLWEPVEKRLQQMGDQAKGLAKRLGKGEVEVQIAAANVRVTGKRWAPFWSAMVHIIRNSVDHAFENEAERQKGAGTKTPKLELSAEERDGAVVIIVRDNGRGIDWEAVRSRAESLGLAARTRADLEQALFADGLSTKREVSDVSGRGVGMAAVLRECQALGGRITIESSSAGTMFRFTIPDRPTVRPSSASSSPLRTGVFDRA